MFSQLDFEDLMSSWKAKMDAVDTNVMAWGLVIARK
jgi:hypothetical protein